jgi:hypothetical protein
MLATSPDLRAQFGRANRKVAAEFDWNKSSAGDADLLENLASS